MYWPPLVLVILPENISTLSVASPSGVAAEANCGCSSVLGYVVFGDCASSAPTKENARTTEPTIIRFMEHLVEFRTEDRASCWQKIRSGNCVKLRIRWTRDKWRGELSRAREEKGSWRYHQEPETRDSEVTRKAYTLNELPQPQVLLTFGLLNLKPAPSSVSM